MESRSCLKQWRVGGDRLKTGVDVVSTSDRRVVAVPTSIRVICLSEDKLQAIEWSCRVVELIILYYSKMIVRIKHLFADRSTQG